MDLGEASRDSSGFGAMEEVVWASQVAEEAQVQSLGWEDPLDTHTHTQRYGSLRGKEHFLDCEG